MDKWTGDLIGEMHNNHITYDQLASRLGVTKGYISAVLNCRKKPKEAQERFTQAVNELIAEKRAAGCPPLR